MKNILPSIAFLMVAFSAKGQFTGPITKADLGVEVGRRSKMELPIKFTGLVKEQGNIYGHYCGTPFRPVLRKRRSSNYFCETMPATPIMVSNPNPTFLNTWQTADGSILESPLSDSMSVDIVLNLEIRDLEAREENGEHHLTWNVSNNQMATGYSIEDSYDNITFNNIADISPRDEGENSRYEFIHPVFTNSKPLTFYRVKAINNAGEISYSNLAMIRNDKKSDGNRQMVIFPNPGNGNFKLATYCNGKAQTKYEVFDQLGRSISKSFLQLEAGINQVDLTALSNLSTGVYIVVFYTPNKIVSQKVIVNR